MSTCHKEIISCTKKTGQARIELAHQGFRTKIGDPELFPKFKLSLARVLSSDSSLELMALIPNFPPQLTLLFIRI